MRTLFVGAGATGGYFGGRLAAAGRDVTFLVRPGRAAVLEKRGLRIINPDGEITVDARTVTADQIDGTYDLVVLAVKAYQLEQALVDLTPAIGPRTVVVPLLNGIRHIDRLVSAYGKDRAWGGVCLISSTLNADGDVVQMTGMHRLGYGPLDGHEDERLPQVTEALSGEEFDSNPSLTIVRDMWEKWAFLATLGAATTLMRGTLGDINTAPGGLGFTKALADEVMAVVAAAGHAEREGAAAYVRDAVTTTEPMTSSMYRDLSAGQPVEADAIVGDLVAEGAKHGVATPLLSAAYTSLSIYTAKRIG